MTSPISRERLRRLVEKVLDEFSSPDSGGQEAPDESPYGAGSTVSGPFSSAASFSPVPGPQGGNPSSRPGMDRRVAIGSDHGGFALKKRLKEVLAELGYEAIDVGTDSPQSCDYPDFAVKVGRQVQAGACHFGVMIDGAGIGSAMALNKMKGIRAATVHNEATAVNSREHNDANVLVLGSGQIHSGHAARLLRIWLRTGHAGGRHARRVEKINALDERHFE